MDEQELKYWATFNRIPRVASALAMMELKGLVKQVGGMNYIRLSETPAEYQAV